MANIRCIHHRSTEAKIPGTRLGANLKIFNREIFFKYLCTHWNTVLFVFPIIWLVSSPVTEIWVYDSKVKIFLQKIDK